MDFDECFRCVMPGNSVMQIKLEGLGKDYKLEDGLGQFKSFVYSENQNDGTIILPCSATR